MDTNQPSKKDMEQTTQSNQNPETDKEFMEAVYRAEEQRIAIFNRDLKNPPRLSSVKDSDTFKVEFADDTWDSGTGDFYKLNYDLNKSKS